MKLTPKAVLAAALCVAMAVARGCSREPDQAGSDGGTNAPLVILTTTDTPPYSYRDAETGEIVGLEIDIARDAAAKMGRSLEIRRANFPDLIPMVSEGKADMAASGITITEGRLQAVDFSIPYATEGGMFLYRAGETMPTMIRAEKMRIATMDASTYDFYLTSHGVDPIRYAAFANALADLRAMRIDALFFDSCAVKLRAAESNGELAASRLETRENFGIAVKKGNSGLKAALDEAILARRAR